MSLSKLLLDWRWPVMALLASFAMLGGAHAFEQFGKLLPCELCLRQRDVYWAAIAMILTGLTLSQLRPGRRFLTALNVLIGMVFVTSAVVAFYHAGVELKWWQGPTGCSGGAPIDPLSIDLSKLDKPMATGSCAEVPWSFLGISMAGWNGLISVGLATASFIAARVTQVHGRSL